MHATWIRTALGAAVLALAGVPACDDDDDRLPARTCSDCGGEGGGGAGAGVAVDSAGASGSSIQPHGGAGAATGGAGPGGTGTSEVVGGQGGAGGAGGVGAGGGGAGNEGEYGEQLQVCARLANGADDALTVQTSYTSALYADCRVRWLFPKGQAYIDFGNELRRFSFQFWGCPGTPHVYKFSLVSGTPALSQGDVNLLIEQYLVAAQAAVDLTSDERHDMQAALARLSQSLIVNPSLEPSQPACGTGGSGGTGGVDAGGSGGAGGVDAAGGAK